MATGHSAESHKITRLAQKNNEDDFHHPTEKIAQLEEIKSIICEDILEVFGGQGNLTKWYQEIGTVTTLTKETTGDSFEYIYKLRSEKRKFNWIDIDSYGYPDRLFPVIFELMKDECGLVFTFPQVGVNCHNGISQQHFSTFYCNPTPTIGNVVGKITDWALREWMLASLVDVKKIKRIYRIVFMCKRVKATDMTNVRNR
jgi:hypothetical protein